METLYLDTHAALWLYAGKVELFPLCVREFMDDAQLAISPMVLLEIQFLREAGKINLKLDTFIRDMHSEVGLKICEAPFASVTLEASRINWTRDPFDRLIVAQSAAEEAGLVTRDKVILKNYNQAVWD
jgi:PIN domain nuclease of toxin-antitoxin system